MMDKCFETDWANGRFKIVKDPEDLVKVKELFRKVYKQYLGCYKYYASICPVGDVWALSQFSFGEFIDKT